MSKQDQKISRSSRLKITNPDAAGIDIGAKIHYVCVPEGRDNLRIQSFGCLPKTFMPWQHG